MITKITRRRLRKLINESLRSFFMGVEPTNLLDTLRKDPDIDPRIKEMLNDTNIESQKQGMEILISLQDPKIINKYPQLASDEVDLDLDLVDRSQHGYRKQFSKAQSRIANLSIKAIAKSTIPDADFKEKFFGAFLVIRTKDLNSAEMFVRKIQETELGNFLSYSNSKGSFEAAHRGTYVVGPHPKTQKYKIVFSFVDPDWWRGRETKLGPYPS